MIMNSVERLRRGTNVLYSPRADDELVPKRSTRQRNVSPAMAALDTLFGTFDELCEIEEQREVDHLCHLRRRLEQLLIDIDFNSQMIEIDIRNRQLSIVVSDRAADEFVDFVEGRGNRPRS